MAAGYGRKYSTPLERLITGDIVAAFLAKHGYVGIGRVVEQCLPVSEFRINGQRLSLSMLKGPELLHDTSRLLKNYFLHTFLFKNPNDFGSVF